MTQLDDIEDMIKAILQATTTVKLEGSEKDNKDLKNKIKKIKVKK